MKTKIQEGTKHRRIHARGSSTEGELNFKGIRISRTKYIKGDKMHEKKIKILGKETQKNI